jgi:hypothetical protein
MASVVAARNFHRRASETAFGEDASGGGACIGEDHGEVFAVVFDAHIGDI